LETPEYKITQYEHKKPIKVTLIELTYTFQQDNIGQSMLDKVRCSWEHVEEHIWELGEGTGWVIDAYALRTTNKSKKSNTPYHP
jgi:hypothetical protein